MDRHAIQLTSQVFMAVGVLGFVGTLMWNRFKRERKEPEL